MKSASLFRLDLTASSFEIMRVTPRDTVTLETSLVRILTREQAEEEDRTFWHSKTPAERLAAAEQLRQIAYGYDASTARIHAIFVYTQHEKG